MASSEISLQSPYHIWGVPPQPPMEPSAALNAWLTMRASYVDWWSWYTGQRLYDTDPTAKTEEPAYLYPLHINPIRMIAQRHATALFGEVPDDADSNFEMYFTKPDKSIDDSCGKAADIVNTVLSDSNARTMQDTNAELSQFAGGCVTKLRWDPRNPNLTYGVAAESVTVDYFYPVYEIGNPSELLEAHVFYYISVEEAKSRYGVKNLDSHLGKVLYWEHWTRDRYKIQIGGVVPSLQVGDATILMDEVNPFGFVPFYYTPHNSRVGGFYGWSHVPGLIGLTKELNYRMADAGDYVKQNSGSLYYDSNVSGAFKIRPIAPGIKSLSLGNSFNGNKPEVGRLETPSVGHNIHMEYARELWGYIEKEGSAPAVSWGVDEGSQRSALTLAFRMWPLTSHVRRERSQWTATNAAIARGILRMVKVKGTADVPADMLKLKPKTRWAPMMPRDRIEEVNEWVLRVPANIGSINQAVNSLARGEDVNEHLAQIEADRRLMSELAIKEKGAGSAAKPKADTKDAVT